MRDNMNIELTGLTAPRKLLNILVHVYNQKDTTQATKDYIELELRHMYKGYDIKELLRGE